MNIALAATHHDTDGRLLAQTARMLPILKELYCCVAIAVTATTLEANLQLLQQAGVALHIGGTDWPSGHLKLGLWRRTAVATALQNAPTATHIHFCDFDRVLHWAETNPTELQQTLEALPRYDFTVLGRTPRAFASHPKVQRDTEAIVNQVFGLVYGQAWDVTAASRGLSRRAAEAIVTDCDDDTIGTDCSWPLFIRKREDFTSGYSETEGLEFETLDRYGDEIAALGGADAWIARVDADPHAWTLRLDLARAEVAAALAYA